MDHTLLLNVMSLLSFNTEYYLLHLLILCYCVHFFLFHDTFLQVQSSHENTPHLDLSDYFFVIKFRLNTDLTRGLQR